MDQGGCGFNVERGVDLLPPQPRMGGASSRRKNQRRKLNIPIGSTVTFVSYNIWFDLKEQAARTQALLAEIERLSPDFVGLQEVTHQTFPVINARLHHLGYQPHDQVDARDR